MFKSLKNILEMIRFSHTLLALPFALLAAVMAWASPAPGGVSGRFSLAAFARPADFAWSGRGAPPWLSTASPIVASMLRNPRTSGRHLPAGVLSVSQVAVFT